MSDIVIKVENLSKQYQLGTIGSGTLYRDVQSWLAKFRGKEDPNTQISGWNKSQIDMKHSFWALKNVSFELNRGELFGIIGRNGAGKSTLLKLLSRITTPTHGRIKLNGRLASLLEVGTGFHQELTGRENIYLNGSILGMTKQEISRRMDAIIEFSEVAKFIDTPVKRYSSGMYVRLAFAVASHMSADIMIIDEVLAVGDAAFQQKCMDKMKQITENGTTVLFVSHNMSIINSLTTSCIWIDKGVVKANGPTAKVTEQYLLAGCNFDDLVVDLSENANRQVGMLPVLRSIACKNKFGEYCRDFFQNDEICIEISYCNECGINLIDGCGFGIYTNAGIRVSGANSYMKNKQPWSIPQEGTITFTLMPRQLNPGRYLISPAVASNAGSVLLDKVDCAISISISQYDIYDTGYLLTPDDGFFSLDFSMKTN